MIQCISHPCLEIILLLICGFDFFFTFFQFLITNKRVYLMRNKQPDEESIALQVDYNNLVRATAVMQQGEWCFELTVKMVSPYVIFLAKVSGLAWSVCVN